MGPGEIAYLGIVVGGMALFAAGLAYASWIAPGEKSR